MGTYDIAVIGSGAGLNIASQAASEGLSVALFDKGLAGGTCLNVGCIPSKLLISVADRIQEINEAEKFGIKSKISEINFGKIMAYMKDHVEDDRKLIEVSLKRSANPSFFSEETYFLDNYTLFPDSH